jgi:hypothetical protein
MYFRQKNLIGNFSSECMHVCTCVPSIHTYACILCASDLVTAVLLFTSDLICHVLSQCLSYMSRFVTVFTSDLICHVL